MSWIQVGITDSPISINEVYSALNQNNLGPDNVGNNTEHGAQLLFTGVIRNNNLGKKVIGVSYDAFIPLVKSVFQTICEEANGKWGPGLKLILIHRVGRLAVGEVSVAIAVSARHRDEAYQASRYVIENLKHRAPLWKKEHYTDGDTQWLEGHALCGH